MGNRLRGFLFPGTRKKSRGFTLTEVMVVCAVLGVIASLAPKMFIEVSRFYIMNKTRLELQRESRAIMTVITRNLRQADANSIVIDRSTSSQPYYSRIQFTKQDGSALKFYQENKNLKQQDGTKTLTLSRNLRYLAFAMPRTDNMGIVSVSMTFEQAIFEGKYKALHLASEKVRVMN